MLLELTMPVVVFSTNHMGAEHETSIFTWKYEAEI